VEPWEIVRAILIVVAAYLIGGIPWGVIIARLSGGPDPRTIGSGRTGGSNVMRALGPRLALLAGILDLLKGVAAVLLARALGAGPGVEVVAALAAVVGHSRSPFLGLGGGRGIATGFGALLVFYPPAALAIIPVFALTIWITRYSSVGSLVACATGGLLLAIATSVVPLSPWYYLYAAVGTLLIFLFHTDNIQRLFAGQERRIGTPRAPDAPDAPETTDGSGLG
jgi:glycerol-3-phosphate acyltransferase PlsY